MRLLWVVIRLAKCERGRAAAAARRQCAVWYSATPSEAAGLRRRACDAPRVALRKQRRRAARERRPAPASDEGRASGGREWRGARRPRSALPARRRLRWPSRARAPPHHASPFALSHPLPLAAHPPPSAATLYPSRPSQRTLRLHLPPVRRRLGAHSPVVSSPALASLNPPHAAPRWAAEQCVQRPGCAALPDAHLRPVRAPAVQGRPRGRAAQPADRR